MKRFFSVLLVVVAASLWLFITGLQENTGLSRADLAVVSIVGGLLGIIGGALLVIVLLFLITRVVSPAVRLRSEIAKARGESGLGVDLFIGDFPALWRRMWK